MKDLYEAVRNAESWEKDRFLKQVDMSEYAPYVGEVLYMRYLYGSAMRTVTGFMLPFGDIPLSRIKVSEYAFEKFCWEEFYNILVPHEGFHAKQHYENPVIHTDKLFNDVITLFGMGDAREIETYRREIEAIENQMMHPSFLDCGEKFRLGVELRKVRCEKRLLELERNAY